MKKIVLTVTLTLFTLFITRSQIIPTLKAGVTFPSISSYQSKDLQDAPGAVDYSMSTSFYIGGTVDISVTKSTYFQTGVTFIGKGGKDVFSGNTQKIKTYYIEIPANFLFKFPVGKDNIVLGAGPYFALATGGKIKSTSSSGQAYNEDVSFGQRFKRADYGVNFVTGFEFYKNLTVNVGYGLGLMNIRGQGADYIADRNRVLSAGLGYRF